MNNLAGQHYEVDWFESIGIIERTGSIGGCKRWGKLARNSDTLQTSVITVQYSINYKHSCN